MKKKKPSKKKKPPQNRKETGEFIATSKEDTDYQTEALRIAEEFADSDAETISLVDQLDDSEGNPVQGKPKRFKPGESGNPATRFKPGQSGNPGGRPKKTKITDAYRALLEDPLPESMEIKLFGEVKGRSWAEAIAMGQARQAVIGKSPAAAELREATEGRAPQAIFISGELDLNIENVDAKIKQLGDRIRERKK